MQKFVSKIIMSGLARIITHYFIDNEGWYDRTEVLNRLQVLHEDLWTRPQFGPGQQILPLQTRGGWEIRTVTDGQWGDNIGALPLGELPPDWPLRRM